MDYDSSIRIWQRIETDEVEFRRELLSCAVRYARLRVDWQIAPPDDRRELEVTRTAAHNALIDAVNILSRAMVKKGETTAWRRELGEDRKDIGDWACHVHAYLGIEAR